MAANMKRRDFLRAVAASAPGYVTSGIAGGFLEASGERIFHAVFEKKKIEGVEKEALDFLFDGLVSLPSIYAGKGNSIGRTRGLNGISDYLQFGSSQFTNYIATALKAELKTVGDNEGPEFLYDPNKSAIFLGSPAANAITSNILGYRTIETRANGKIIMLPKPNLDSGSARWVFVFGETGFGTYGEIEERAFRYSKSTGELVHRPIYKLFDKDSKKLLAPTLRDGFLENEWVTILKIVQHGVPKLIVAGMHGYSIDAFCRNLTASIENLERTVGSSSQYQVVAPVELVHDKDALLKPVTMGEIDWSKAQVQEIS